MAEFRFNSVHKHDWWKIDLKDLETSKASRISISGHGDKGSSFHGCTRLTEAMALEVIKYTSRLFFIDVDRYYLVFWSPFDLQNYVAVVSDEDEVPILLQVMLLRTYSSSPRHSVRILPSKLMGARQRAVNWLKTIYEPPQPGTSGHQWHLIILYHVADSHGRSPLRRLMMLMAIPRVDDDDDWEPPPGYVPGPKVLNLKPADACSGHVFYWKFLDTIKAHGIKAKHVKAMYAICGKKHLREFEFWHETIQRNARETRDDDKQSAASS